MNDELHFVFTLDFTNAILNALNSPFQTPAIVAASLIREIDAQASPQVVRISEEKKAAEEIVRQAEETANEK